MKIYIPELEADYEIHIYGIDGNEHTEKFLLLVFGTGLKRLDEYEKQAFDTEADYAMSESTLNAVAVVIDNVQEAIDEIAEEGGSTEKYTYDKKCYIV